MKDIFGFIRISYEYKCQCLGYDDMTITSYFKGIIGARMIACYTYRTKEDSVKSLIKGQMIVYSR